MRLNRPPYRHGNSGSHLGGILILTIFIVGGVLLIVLFALKSLFRDRLPKKARNFLWLVAPAVLITLLSVFLPVPETATVAQIEGFTFKEIPQHYRLTTDEESYLYAFEIYPDGTIYNYYSYFSGKSPSRWRMEGDKLVLTVFYIDFETDAYLTVSNGGERLILESSPLGNIPNGSEYVYTPASTTEE